MSTRSRVGIILDDGKILSIYSHADGYIQGVGAELIKGYNSKELALKLIKKGNTGFVESPIEKCEFYGEKPELSKDYHGFLDLALNCSAEYVYIFDPDDNKWWYAKRSGGQFSRFKNLEADLAENPEYRDDYSDDDLDDGFEFEGDSVEESVNPTDMNSLLPNETKLDPNNVDYDALTNQASNAVKEAIESLVDNYQDELMSMLEEWISEMEEQGFDSDELMDIVKSEIDSFFK